MLRYQSWTIFLVYVYKPDIAAKATPVSLAAKLKLAQKVATTTQQLIKTPVEYKQFF